MGSTGSHGMFTRFGVTAAGMVAAFLAMAAVPATANSAAAFQTEDATGTQIACFQHRTGAAYEGDVVALTPDEDGEWAYAGRLEYVGPSGCGTWEVTADYDYIFAAVLVDGPVEYFGATEPTRVGAGETYEHPVVTLHCEGPCPYPAD